ncbi:MAG: hypothetical protein RLZZ468_1446 [Cyanobacteriota bacterium]
MIAFCEGPEPPTTAQGQTVTNRYKPLAPCLGCGSCPPDRRPLRDWLRAEPTWAVLAAAGLTHPQTVVRRARCLGLQPHWAGRTRTWSWAELQRIASPEAERLDRIERERRALWRRAR